MGNLSIKKLIVVIVLTVVSCFSFSLHSFSQTRDSEIQSLYDQANVLAFISPDAGRSIYSILNYSYYTMSFPRIFSESDMLSAFQSGAVLSHTGTIQESTPYIEDLMLRDRYTGQFLNLHLFRGNTAYQPQFPYKQNFLIYKILLPQALHLNINSNTTRTFPTELHLALKYDANYVGLRENMMYVFKSSNLGDPFLNLEEPSSIIDIDLPKGEYYLLVSTSKYGSRSAYLRGNIKTDIKVSAPINKQTRNIVNENIESSIDRDLKITTDGDQVFVEFKSLEGVKSANLSVYSFPKGELITSCKVKNIKESLSLRKQDSNMYILLVDIDGKKSSYKFVK